MSPVKKDPRIDAYIARAQPFAQPILTRYREMVHRACPAVEEMMKWSHPHFDYRGAIMTAMAAFKAHAAVGFWHGGKVLGPKAKRGEAFGHLGRLTSVKDLPSQAQATALIRKAMALNEAGVKMKRTSKPKPPIKTPRDVVAALAASKKAQAAWDAFAPSHKREYLEWIIEAKTEETRERRLEQAITWIAEGKQRNWRYQR